MSQIKVQIPQMKIFFFYISAAVSIFRRITQTHLFSVQGVETTVLRESQTVRNTVQRETTLETSGL